MNNEKQLIEELAKKAHESWSGWMEYLFSLSTEQSEGSVLIPSDIVSRWKRQMNTHYSNLTEIEKCSDRIEAKKYLNCFKQYQPNNQDDEKRIEELEQELNEYAKFIAKLFMEYITIKEKNNE